MIAACNADPDLLSLSQLQLVVSAGDRYEAAWKTRSRPSIESFLPEAEPETRPHLFRTLLELELELRNRHGESASLADYSGRFGEFTEILRSVFVVAGNATHSVSNISETKNDSNWATNWAPGQVVNGYELVRRIGQGGMGIVFKARQRSAGGRLVALKVVRPDLLGQPSESVKSELLARFQSEVRAAASIEHDHIVPLYEAGEAEGLPYYAMRFVDGSNLAQLLELGPLSGLRATELLEPVVRAVAHLHERKLLHRDIKPRNLILDANGRLLLTDFGLAKQLEALSVEATISNPMVGTPAYMSPEQARGTGRVGPATDIYSLGATLYEMLTGKTPFHGTSALEVLRQVLDEEPVSPERVNENVDRSLALVCMKCLRKEPEQRYPDAVALAEDLARHRAGATPHARAPGSIYQARKWSKRRPVVTALGLALVILIPTIAFAFRWLEKQTERARTGDLIRALLTAKTEAFLETVDEATKSSLPVAAGLEATFASSLPGSNGKMRAALGLLRLCQPIAPSELANYVEAQLDQLEPASIVVARTVLNSFRTELEHRFWTEVRDKNKPSMHRLRVACLLAGWDAQTPDWNEIAGEVTTSLLDAGPEEQKNWAFLLIPAAAKLRPALLSYFRERTEQEKARRAATVLSILFADNIDFLIGLVEEAQPCQLRVLAKSMVTSMPAAQAAMREALSRAAAVGNADQVAASNKLANLAAVAFRMEWGPVLSQFLSRQEPTLLVRSFLIHRLESAGVDADMLVQALKREQDTTARIALLLACGEYYRDQFSQEYGKQLLSTAMELFKTDIDAGVHSASEWLLLRLGIREADLVQAERATSQCPCQERNWFVGANGHTMSVFFETPRDGMALTKGEPGHRSKAVSQKGQLAPFAICTKETTMRQMLALEPERTILDSQLPITNINFEAAARYCNDLSKAEEIPMEQWCYENVDGKLKLVHDFHKRRGYRLPTEQEWEYACRANCPDTWFFGKARELLTNYCWHLENSNGKLARVGLLKPNDFGLFDMLGNAQEWCCLEDGSTNSVLQALRGGSIENVSMFLETCGRATVLASTSGANRGFRVARSLPRKQ